MYQQTLLLSFQPLVQHQPALPCCYPQVPTASSAKRSTTWSMSSRQCLLVTSATAPSAGELLAIIGGHSSIHVV